MKYRIAILFNGKVWRSPFFYSSVRRCTDL